VNSGLEPFVTRVTMTPPQLANADVVLFLVTGSEKADAVARAFEGPETDAVPASRIRSRAGRTLVVLDREAAERLSALI
jgi:6-phosphogluconolactonase/glucosamine-6-phosphate isomerase/deaminase